MDVGRQSLPNFTGVLGKDLACEFVLLTNSISFLYFFTPASSYILFNTVSQSLPKVIHRQALSFFLTKGVASAPSLL